MIIQQWQKQFREIYPNSPLSPDYIMVHLYTNCSSLGKSILKRNTVKASDHYVIRTIAWINALASRFKVDYAEALIHRFPGRCPYCLMGPCRCAVNTGARDPQTKEMYSDLEKKRELKQSAEAYLSNPAILTYDWFIENINKIYPSNRMLLYRGGQSYVISKFLEEGGELHRAYSCYLRGSSEVKSIAAEIADLSSWVISCWDVARNGRKFSAELLSEYHAGCPSCKKPVCKCATYSITMGVEEIIRDLAGELRSLKAEMSDTPTEIDEALATTEEINMTRDFSKSKNLPAQLERGLQILEKADKVSGTAKGIMGNINEMIEIRRSITL